LENDESRHTRLTTALQGTALETVPFDLHLTYSHFTMDVVLKRLLPPEIVAPVAFEVAGNIAHFNLRDEMLPFKELIGQVVRDKNPRIRTVVNKVGQIANQFRTFPLEVIGGEPRFDVDVSESGCRFQFDFSRVYWNSRLQAEHERIISLCRNGDVVYDMFAGVGPFAVPTAKKGCVVFGNDLNPESYKALIHNRALNKVRDSALTALNLDARDFVRQYVVPQAKAQSHILMNLPALGPDFCDCFRGVFHARAAEAATAVMPMVHCYGFTKQADYRADMRQRICEAMECDSLPDDTHYQLVREVAPEKLMICVSFRLPLDVATAEPTTPSAKKRRTTADLNEEETMD
jgi:tRNA (guanine37-N1)-methyltransferase